MNLRDAGLVLSDSPYGTVNAAGTYTFEYARPLRTNDVRQQVCTHVDDLLHKLLITWLLKKRCLNVVQLKELVNLLSCASWISSQGKV